MVPHHNQAIAGGYSMMRKLDSALGVLVGLGWLVRGFMWAGGLDYVIAAVFLLVAGILAWRGRDLIYLAGAWGVFLGMNLFSFATSALSTVDGFHKENMGFLVFPALVGCLGLGLTFSVRRIERRS